MVLSSNELSSRFWGLRFCPPDPAWASKPLLERTRRALKAYDRHLNIWWCPNRGLARGDEEMPGRWRVVRYGERAGGWKKWFYWEGPQGEYRHPFPVEPILEKVKAGEHNMRELAIAIDQRNDRIKERQREEAMREVHAGAREAYRFYMNRKIISAPGYIRSRAATRRAARIARDGAGR